MLLADPVGHLSSRIAEVELEDGFSDVVVRALHHVFAEVAPVEVPRVPSRKHIERTPSATEELDDSCVSLRTIDGRERSLNMRIQRFEQHQCCHRSLDAVRVIRKEPHSLRHVAHDVTNAFLTVVIRLRQRTEPRHNGLSRA